MNRSWIKDAAAMFLYQTGMDRALRPRDVPVVVTYHRVVEDFGSACATSNPSMLVSLKMLERHLNWIGRRYRFVQLDELGSRLESGDPAAGRLAAITFDDGYQDFYDLALPLLQRKGIPAAVFVMTDYVGTSLAPLHDKLYLLLKRLRGALPKPVYQYAHVADVKKLDPYDALRAMLELLPMSAVQSIVQALEAEDPLPADLCEPFRCLSWETLERVQRAGITVGSHTRSHVLMPNESRTRVLDEAEGSRATLQQRLPGAAVRHFAYPSGLCDATSVRAVSSAGYRFAYTTSSRRSAEYPLLTIPRTVLWENSCVGAHRVFSGAVLNCQIHHAFDAFASSGAYRETHAFRREHGG